jgi:hypothetical protein
MSHSCQYGGRREKKNTNIPGWEEGLQVHCDGARPRYRIHHVAVGESRKSKGAIAEGSTIVRILHALRATLERGHGKERRGRRGGGRRRGGDGRDHSEGEWEGKVEKEGADSKVEWH